MAMTTITVQMVDAVLDACDPGRPSPALRDLLDKHHEWQVRTPHERFAVVEGSSAWYAVRAAWSGDCDSRRCGTYDEACAQLARWAP